MTRLLDPPITPLSAYFDPPQSCTSFCPPPPPPLAGLYRCPGNGPNCALNKGSRGAFFASREVVLSTLHPDLLKPSFPVHASLVAMAPGLEIWSCGMAELGMQAGLKGGG